MPSGKDLGFISMDTKKLSGTFRSPDGADTMCYGVIQRMVGTLATVTHQSKAFRPLIANQWIYSVLT
jgi:hypothetical protein